MMDFCEPELADVVPVRVGVAMEVALWFGELEAPTPKMRAAGDAAAHCLTLYLLGETELDDDASDDDSSAADVADPDRPGRQP